MELEEAMQRVGKLGRYQVFVYALVSSGGLMLAFHAFSMTFVGAQLPHLCRGGAEEGGNVTERRKCQQPVEYNHSAIYQDAPNMSLTNSNTTEPGWETCTNGWAFDYSIFQGDTIVTEWQLVCGSEYLVPLSNTIYFIGLMVGSLLHTYLSDNYGRKRIFLICFWMIGVCGVIEAVSMNIIMFIVVRFIIGTFVQGSVLVSVVYMSELFSAHHRHLTCLVGSTLWSLGFMMLPGMAYLLPYWRHLLLLISLPFLLTIPYYWLVPESLHWLVANRRLSEAEAVLEKAARVNRRSLPRACLTQAQDTGADADATGADSDATGADPDATGVNSDASDQEGVVASPQPAHANMWRPSVRFTSSPPHLTSHDLTSHDLTSHDLTSHDLTPPHHRPSHVASYGRRKSVVDIVKTRPLRPRTAIMFFMWFVNSIVYYGLSMNTSALSGNPYLNFFYSGCAELPGAAVAVFMMKYGRRPQLCAALITAGVPLLILPFIPAHTSNGIALAPLVTALAMIGKFGITVSFTIVLLYAAEIYPTVVRNAGIGIASVGARVGGMVAPFATTVGEMVPMVPPLVFGSLSLLAASLVFLLPDTFDQQLPEHLEEVESVEKKFSYLKPTADNRRPSADKVKSLISRL